MDTCECCGRSLRGGELTLPWEDGDNAYAYVTCPHCGPMNGRALGSRTTTGMSIVWRAIES